MVCTAVHGSGGNWKKMKKCCPPRPGRGSGPALPTPVRNPGVWPCASRKTSCRTENQQVRSPGAPPGRRSRAPGRFARLPAEAGRTLAPQELPLSRWAKRGVRPAWWAEPMCIWAQPTPAPPGRAPALCEIRKVHNSIRFFRRCPAAPSAGCCPQRAQRTPLTPAGTRGGAGDPQENVFRPNPGVPRRGGRPPFALCEIRQVRNSIFSRALGPRRAPRPPLGSDCFADARPTKCQPSWPTGGGERPPPRGGEPVGTPRIFWGDSNYFFRADPAAPCGNRRPQRAQRAPLTPTGTRGGAGDQSEIFFGRIPAFRAGVGAARGNPQSAKLDFLPRPGTPAGAQAPTGLRSLR